MRKIKVPRGWENSEGFGVKSEFVLAPHGAIKTPAEMIRAIEKSWDEIEIVGAGAMPTLLVDCGKGGCVFETEDPHVYLKATRIYDEFATSQLFLESPSEGFVPIYDTYKLSDDLYLVWKARLEAAGIAALEWLEEGGSDMNEMQHATLLTRKYRSAQIQGATKETFAKIIREIGQVDEFAAIAALLDKLLSIDLALNDTHLGNIGVLSEDGRARMVVFDSDLKSLQTTCQICQSPHHFIKDCMKLLKKNTRLSWNKIYAELDAKMQRMMGETLIESYSWGGHTPTKEEILDSLKWGDIGVDQYPVFKAYVWEKMYNQPPFEL